MLLRRQRHHDAAIIETVRDWAWWTDPSRDWWLRHSHALGHLQRLRTEIQDYKRGDPIAAVPEPGRTPDEVQFRLRLDKPVPPVVGLVAGDVLHSLRAALDNLVFAMVEAEHGRLGSDKDALVVQFPIAPSPEAFERFFDYRIKSAIRSVQPFHWLAEAKKLEVPNAKDLSYEEVSQHETLWILGKLSNLDKHWRLPVTAWRPSTVFYWGSDGESNAEWRPTKQPPWNDGDIIARMQYEGEMPDVVHQFNVVLVDLVIEGAHFFASHDLLKDAEQWCQGVHLAMHTVLQQFVP